MCVSFQGELETQKRQHEAKLITTKEEEKLKMDKMALELELKWTETLRCVSREAEKLTGEHQLGSLFCFLSFFQR